MILAPHRPKNTVLLLLLLLLLLVVVVVVVVVQTKTRAYFGICLMFLQGDHGVFHRFEKELWCRLLAPFLN